MWLKRVGSLQRAARDSCAQERRRRSARSRCTTSAADVSHVPRATHGLTHLDASNRPTMVDVGAKEVTHASPTAEARVRLPREVARALRKQRPPHEERPGVRHCDHRRRHGGEAHARVDSVLPSAGLENCKVEIEDERGGGIVIRCRCPCITAPAWRWKRSPAQASRR